MNTVRRSGEGTNGRGISVLVSHMTMDEEPGSATGVWRREVKGVFFNACSSGSPVWASVKVSTSIVRVLKAFTAERERASATGLLAPETWRMSLVNCEI